MLKYEHIQPGTCVRAYDHEPMEDRPERFLEGRVVRHDTMVCGARSLVVECTRDATFSKHDFFQGQSYSREGEEVHVPMEIGLGEYDGRVKVIVGSTGA